MYTYYAGSGKNRSRRYDVKWEARGPGCVTANPTGARLSFRFDVPHGLPASEKPRGDYHLWRLHVEGNQLDVPFRRTFEIGVFPTGERSRHVHVDTTKARAEAVREVLEGAVAGLPAAVQLREDLGLTIEARNDWLRLCLGTGRQKPLAFLFGGIGLVFLGVALVYADASALERLVFGVIGSMGVAVGLYLPFNALDVRISRREIRRVRTWLGMVIRRQKIRPAQLQALEIEQGASYYVNHRTTVYYRLEGIGGFGKFRLLESIPDRTLVAGIREQVMAYAGLRDRRLAS